MKKFTFLTLSVLISSCSNNFPLEETKNEQFEYLATETIKAKDFYSRSKYEEAFKLFSLGIEKNDPEAIYGLANMYEYGQYVKEDKNKANSLYKIAYEKFSVLAKQNDANAIVRLGRMYEFGDYVNTDKLKAYRLYERAVKLNNAEAASILASVYKTGSLPEYPEDHHKSFLLLKQSAENGDVKSYSRLAQYYEQGIGIKIDNKQAFKWYKKSAEHNQINGLGKMGKIYLNGELGVKKDYSQSIYWLKKLVQESNDFEFNLGQAYYKKGDKMNAKKYIGLACEKVKDVPNSLFCAEYKRLF